MSSLRKRLREFGARTRGAFTRDSMRKHMPDIFVLIAFGLALMAIRLRFPGKFGALLSTLLTELRVTRTPYYIEVSIRSLPGMRWRVPTQRGMHDGFSGRVIEHSELKDPKNRS